jgi:hypothetical protein
MCSMKLVFVLGVVPQKAVLGKAVFVSQQTLRRTQTNPS